MKHRSLGLTLIILGVLLNNFAYLTDVVGNTHEGLIYLGWKGAAAAIVGLLLTFAGVWVLLQAGKGDEPGA